ncbi:11420_t:CDS:1 [Diversispora eburnea]|uniref:11420_t:CDS:1 n=1 Tax=Diversispora eburnea TaxID=1213867 RepID=A0A9N9AE70_9GLOM|nr:11420_t:CDS:1 [Diversispora eburnea]
MINLLKENGYYKEEKEDPNGHNKNDNKNDLNIGNINMVPTSFLLYFLTIQNELMNSKIIPYKKYSKELSMVATINWRKADKEFRQAFSRMTIELNRDERFLQK